MVHKYLYLIPKTAIQSVTRNSYLIKEFILPSLKIRVNFSTPLSVNIFLAFFVHNSKPEGLIEGSGKTVDVFLPGALKVRWNMWTLVVIPVGKICFLVKGEPMDSNFLKSNPLNMCNTATLAVWTTQKSLLSKLFLYLYYQNWKPPNVGGHENESFTIFSNLCLT